MTGQYQVEQECKNTYTFISISRPQIITIYIFILSVHDTKRTTLNMEIE